MSTRRSDSSWSLGIDFLASGNYIAVNRSLIKTFGLEGAVLIGELASEAKYWHDHDKLEDGWFFSTVENVESATGLSGYQQRKALSALTKAGVVETRQKGLPKKRYIRIHFMELVSVVNDKCSKNFTTVGEETASLDDEKLSINNYKEQQQEQSNKEEDKRETFDAIIDGFTDDEELRQTLREFLRYRKAIKKPLTNRALKLNISKLAKLASDPRQQSEIVNQTIERGWTGLFPLKDQSSSVSRRSQYTEEQNQEFDLYSFSPDQIIQL
jgi:hypothetical protein